MTISPEELPERREFDFWLGEWDARWQGGHGTNTVTAELGGTVLLERFDGRPGTELRGLSVTVYDAVENLWRQAWADSTGGYLDFTGGRIEGGMELRRSARLDTPPFRMRFLDIRADSFTWRWERWNEADSSWDEQWRIDYARRA